MVVDYCSSIDLCLTTSAARPSLGGHAHTRARAIAHNASCLPCGCCDKNFTLRRAHLVQHPWCAAGATPDVKKLDSHDLRVVRPGKDLFNHCCQLNCCYRANVGLNGSSPLQVDERNAGTLCIADFERALQVSPSKEALLFHSMAPYFILCLEFHIRLHSPTHTLSLNWGMHSLLDTSLTWSCSPSSW